MDAQDQISRSLDAIKQGGLISEYLVSWRGRGGRLEPAVTVWGETPVESLRGFVAQTLSGLVSTQRITVLAD